MRRQFRLWHLLVLVVAVAIPLALGRQSADGALLAYLLVTFELAFLVTWWTRRKAWGCLTFVGLHAGMCLVGIPILDSEMRGDSRRMQCQNNLKQIALALAIYENQYGSLPPAVTYDATGRPLHSWRVLILPFLEEQVLYEQYHLDEPWDSPNNLLVAQRMPGLFRCPTAGARGSLETQYLAITGPKTLWPDGVGRARAVGGPSNNPIMLIEVPDSDVIWTEPRDLPVAELSLSWSQRTPRNQGLWHSQGQVHFARFNYAIYVAAAEDADEIVRDAHVK